MKGSNNMETRRIDMRIPVKLLEEIEKYQKEQGITSRTGALLELVRIGLSVQNETAK